MVILDTNIIIDHLRQREGGTETVLMQLAQRYDKSLLAISMITIQELYEGTSTRNPKKESYLLATIAPLKVIPYTYDIAQLAGQIARDLKTSIELADATIAATSLAHEAMLCTLNMKDFGAIPGLKLFTDF